MKAGGLFSGIGGFELALHQAGISSAFVSEIDPLANRVLAKRFAGTPNLGDISKLKSLPDVDILVGGFPCQNYSSAGKLEGLSGDSGALLTQLFRLIKASGGKRPKWIILENVAFILSAQRGAAVRLVIQELVKLGYAWAYRTMDTSDFGLPQRRRRWYVVASTECDPSALLMPPRLGNASEVKAEPEAFGFYWTEGNTGIGWAPDMIPPLKVGSKHGIPSPPAIWLKQHGTFVTPSIEDAERLQGFPPNWTAAQENTPKENRLRWRLIGNAVSVPVANWIASSIVAGLSTGTQAESRQRFNVNAGVLPKGASGYKRQAFSHEYLEAPGPGSPMPISRFLRFEPKVLSLRAASGFYTRARKSTLRLSNGFLDSLQRYVEQAS